jgi:E3 ubiquitin-protein ligase MYCBP2
VTPEGGIKFETVKPIMSSYLLPLCSSCHSNERLFLKDFVHCVPGTSGGRLSRWLQPDSYVDPARCEVLYSRDDMRCGWPAIVTVVTKDQYGDVVHVPNLKVGESQ